MFPSEPDDPRGDGSSPSAARVVVAGALVEGPSSAAIALAGMAGSVELAAHLEGWDLTTTSAADLVEIVAAFERVASYARSRAAAAAVELSHRPEMNPEWPDCVGRPSVPCTVGTDLSLRLGVTRRAATTLVETGRVLATVLTDTGSALEAGLVDWPKARTMVEVLAEVPGEVATQVEHVVLPEASGLTEPQLRRRLAVVIAEIDPKEAQARHALARTKRRVSRPRVLPEGMASITATLPAEVAVRLDACLQSAAEVARADGDGRTPDQLRADALDALATLAWDAGRIGPCETCPSVGDEDAPSWSLRSARGRRAQVHVTVGVGTLLGLDERPAALRGYGPIGADVARAIAAEGTWRRILVDEATRMVVDVGKRQYAPPASLVELVRARNPTCIVPTCAVPAQLCETDHTVPFVDGSGGSTSADNLGPACKTHHLYKTHGGYRLAQPVAGSFVVITPTGHTYLTGPERLPGVPSPSCWPPESPPPDAPPSTTRGPDVGLDADQPDAAGAGTDQPKALLRPYGHAVPTGRPWLDRLHPAVQVVMARHADRARRRRPVLMSAFVHDDASGGTVARERETHGPADRPPSRRATGPGQPHGPLEDVPPF